MARAMDLKICMPMLAMRYSCLQFPSGLQVFRPRLSHARERLRFIPHLLTPKGGRTLCSLSTLYIILRVSSRRPSQPRCSLHRPACCQRRARKMGQRIATSKKIKMQTTAVSRYSMPPSTHAMKTTLTKPSRRDIRHPQPQPPRQHATPLPRKHLPQETRAPPPPTAPPLASPSDHRPVRSPNPPNPSSPATRTTSSTTKPSCSWPRCTSRCSSATRKRRRRRSTRPACASSGASGSIAPCRIGRRGRARERRGANNLTTALEARRNRPRGFFLVWGGGVRRTGRLAGASVLRV